MSVYATVIADSIGPLGQRLTTMEVQTWRFVLAEFNTHRCFSRNSASSRAIPFEKQLARMDELGLAYPISWPKEQKGMQGGEEHSETRIIAMKKLWREAAFETTDTAKLLHEKGLHKSVINRLLEPFMWHKIIVSSTDWENFFAQRCSPLAQPEIRVTAEHMQLALEASVPSPISHGEWHMPYIQASDAYEVNHYNDLLRISAARCARVSYLTHDGVRDIAQDIDLYEKLVSAEPPHWSPLEHVARPRWGHESQVGNFERWVQLRHNPLAKDAA